MSSSNGTSLSFPHNLEELQTLAAELLRYKNMHLTYVLVFFCSAYVYKQTFAIPGSVFLVSATTMTTTTFLFLVCT